MRKNFENRTPKNSSTEAYRLANEGVSALLSSVQNYSSHERERIFAANEPTIAVLEAKKAFLIDKRQGLLDQLRRLPTQNSSMGSLVLNLLIAVLLTIAGFGLAEITIQPFNLGLGGHLLCAGLAVALPFATHRFLQHYPWRGIIRTIVAVMFIAALGTLFAFAEIRADQFSHNLRASDVVVFDSEGTRPQTENDAERVAVLLRWALVLAALSFELASGLAWFEFSEARKASASGVRARLEKALRDTEMELLVVVKQLQERLSEPASAFGEILASFDRGLQDAISARRSSPAKRLLTLVFVISLAVGTLHAADSVQVLVGLDLSQTETATGYKGHSEFGENVGAISRILSSVPPGSRISVLGITDRTLTTPYTILSAQMSNDPGYLSTRLEVGRRGLVSEWMKRAKDLTTTAPHTDILGAFLYASEVFSHSEAVRKVLVLFSDMRNESKELDLETPDVIDVRKSLASTERQGLIAPLSGVDVFIFGAGAHSGRKHLAYEAGLRQYWVDYVIRSGGTLRTFSTGRDPEGLNRMFSVGIAQAKQP